MKATHASFALVALLATAEAAAQASPDAGWDTPHGSGGTVTVSGVEVVADELIVGLREWSDYPGFVTQVHDLGDVVLGAIPRLRAVRLRATTTADRPLEAALDGYSELRTVRYAQRHAVGRITEACSQATPDDPLFPLEWHLDNVGQTGGLPGADVHALAAWEITKGSPDVVAAIIDSGIVLDHPEFQGRLLPGWNFVDESSDPSANASFHGAYVAGVLGANGCNDFEVCGLDQRCRILPIKAGNL